MKKVIKNNEIERRLWQKAKIAGYILAMAPFVRMAAVNGSLARGDVNSQSDIDFVIIAKTGRIWSAKAYSTLAMAILGLKRYKDKIAGRVCLNLYQTEDHLELATKTKILAKSHAYTVPLFSDQAVFQKYINANQWIKDFKYDFHPQDPPDIIVRILTNFAKFIRSIEEFVIELVLNDWGERRLKSYQMKRIMEDIRTKESPPGAIFISDKELRFHPPKENSGS